MIFEEKTLSSEYIYEGKILKLRKDRVTVPEGESYREIIEHNGGSVIVPVDEDGNIIMIRQFRKPVERVMLEAPAGKIDPGEDPFETAKRELREETGITAENIVHLTDILPTVGYSGETLYLYMATGLSYGERDLDENEAIDVVKMPFEEVCDKIYSGEIMDAKTVVAVLFAKKLLKK